MFDYSVSKLPARSMIAAGLALFCLISNVNAEDLVPLQIKLPAPAFIGTPSDSPASADVEKPTGKPRPPLMVPPGVTNVALGKTVTSSASNALPEKSGQNHRRRHGSQRNQHRPPAQRRAMGANRFGQVRRKSMPSSSGTPMIRPKYITAWSRRWPITPLHRERPHPL